MPEEQKNNPAFVETSAGKWKIDWRSLLLGTILNILTIIVFILLYHAYIIEPRYQTQAPSTGQEIMPGENVPAP